MTKSNGKSKRAKAKKIIFITIAAIVTIGIFSVAYSSHKVYTKKRDETYIEDTSEPTNSPSAKPSATPRKAYIPDPDDMQSLPHINELQLHEDSMDGEFDEDKLILSWDVVNNADYHVLCAMNNSDNIYHLEILLGDISEWIIPHSETGRVYLLSYEDMGQDSTDDDQLLEVFSYSVHLDDGEPDIELENSPVKEPTNTKTPKKTNSPQKNDSQEPETTVKNKYRILVDKEDFTFAIFTYDKSGDYSILVKAFPTATGTSPRMTPLGIFEISSKGKWKDWGTGSYSPYYTRFTSGLYFHGAVYDLKKEGTMFRSYYNSIGTASSSGCLRTTFEGAKWIYENCPAGTVVEIVESSNLVDRAIKPPLDPAYSRWDPTNPNKPFLDPPQVTENALLNVAQGQSASLKGFLTSTDSTVKNSTLIYEVVSKPEYGTLNKSTFTQDDLDKDLVTYTHIGSSTETDSFEFTVTNQSSTTGVYIFNIQISPVDNIAPTMQTNEWITISIDGEVSLAAYLRATDDIATDSQIIYTITTMPERGSIPETFTQEQLSDGQVIYLHDGLDTTTDSFIFSVSDGTNTLENQMFTISIAEPESSPEPTAEPTPEPTLEPESS